MAVFAIGDLHLSFAVHKPMDRFGPQWAGHPDKIARAWRERVGPEDAVLVCGDTSGALRLPETGPDLEYVGALPGRKILVRGNHDHWWHSRAQVERALPAGIALLHNDAHRVEDWWVCGTRGWDLPGPETEPADRRVYEREVGRLR